MVNFSLYTKKMDYTGKELRPHFLLEKLGIKGSGVGAFIGGCYVPTENLVDWEDRLAHDHIRAQSMVHFIGEFFQISLAEGVLRQRLFMSIVKEVLEKEALKDFILTREGDDIFVVSKKDRKKTKRKLSVSIVTASVVSQLLHVGINIDSEGAPVSAIGLKDIKVEPKAFAKEVLKRFSDEMESIVWACAKVKPVVQS